jgi:hypothetical protein
MNSNENQNKARVISASVTKIERHTKAIYEDNGILGPEFNAWETGRIYWSEIVLGRGTETLTITFPYALHFKKGDIVTLSYNDNNEVFKIELEDSAYIDDDKAP